MYWLHSIDTIVHRIGAQCFYVTELVRVLTELREDRLFSLGTQRSETLRSTYRSMYSSIEVSDTGAGEHTRIKAKATLLEEKVRDTFSAPVTSMARLEIQALTVMLQQLPVCTVMDFLQIQKQESEASLLWRSNIECIAYGSPSFDTLNECALRGISPIATTRTRPEFVGLLQMDAGGNGLVTQSVLNHLAEVAYASVREIALECTENMNAITSYGQNTLLIPGNAGAERLIGPDGRNGV